MAATIPWSSWCCWLTYLLGARGSGEVSEFGALRRRLILVALHSVLVLSICDGGRGVAQRRCSAVSVEHGPSARSATLSVSSWLGSGKPFDGGCDSPSSSRCRVIAGQQATSSLRLLGDVSPFD